MSKIELAQALRSRTDGARRRRLENAALETAADDPHLFTAFAAAGAGRLRLSASFAGANAPRSVLAPCRGAGPAAGRTCARRFADPRTVEVPCAPSAVARPAWGPLGLNSERGPRSCGRTRRSTRRLGRASGPAAGRTCVRAQERRLAFAPTILTLAVALLFAALEVALARAALAPLPAWPARLEVCAGPALLEVRTRRPLAPLAAGRAPGFEGIRPARAGAGFKRPSAALADLGAPRARRARFGGGASPRLIPGRRNALDGDRAPLAVVRRAAFDASARARRVGGDLRPQRRHMLAAALGRGRPRRRAARRLIAFGPAPVRAPIRQASAARSTPSFPRRPRSVPRSPWLRSGAGASWMTSGASKSALASLASFAPNWSRNTRVRTSAASPSARSPSSNGPKETRIRRLTTRPRCSSTFLISRFFPSLAPL